MKRLLIALVASSVLITPVAALAQPAGSFEVAQNYDRSRRPVDRQMDRHVDKHVTIEKRVIVKKKERWARGHRLTPAERRHMAQVRDYRYYKLRPPPRGQQWVRVDNDFLLISLATGVIVGLATAH
ncbi:RcnB family protein [Ensifer adhaerens]|uniref:RcnB family protein n=1 Tax=Ensifer adhaerens TaxID=106592 RepID=UPI0023A922BA|nr:RcnB family protein [Ensifer adhaerens]WDZ78599.1 RcnB family protein [Ensifer adhaerens]